MVVWKKVGLVLCRLEIELRTYHFYVNNNNVKQLKKNNVNCTFNLINIFNMKNTSFIILLF